MTKNMNTVDWIAYVLVVIGALNWGLVAIDASWDLVAIIGNATSMMIATILYALVGLSGLWMIYKAFK